MINKHLQKFALCLLLFLLIASPALAQDMPELSRAPLNPAFVEYMEGLESGTIKTLTESGYPLGYIPPPVERCRQVPDDDQIRVLSLPSSFDLRNTGRLTAVRSQDPYSSCWAFATYSSLESYLKPQATVNFSENNLMLGHGFDYGPADGGNYRMSIAYLARWSGPVKEADDPYGSVYTPGLSAVRHVQQVEFIPNSRPLIKQALIDNGAIHVAMYWEDDPYGASSQGNLPSANYYNPVNNAYYYYGDAYSNHAVAIVGWDDNYPRTNFNAPYPPANGAWIIRNSWGTGYHDDGYFYMSYHDIHAGADATAFHNAEPTTNYSRIYQYDHLGWVGNRGYETIDTAWGANIFTAAGTENLAAVSFYATTINTSYEIRIYTGVSPGNPSSGTLRHVQSGTLARAGYHTIQLNQPVPLISGQRFSVAVKFTTPGSGYPVAVEYALDAYSSAASASPGESFLSHDGIHDWYDISQAWGANVCIKAFTEGSASAVTYNLALTANPSTGGTVIDVTGTGPYVANAVVNIRAVPSAGYSFSHWSSPVGVFANAYAAETTFTIPAENATVTAYFVQTASTSWHNYFDLAARSISFDNGVLAASFDGYGTYLRSSTGQWQQLTPATAVAVAYHNNFLFASFDGFGTWRWSSNQWQQLTPATAIALAYHNNVLYASFEGFGTWRWSNNQWQDSTPATARALAYHNNVLYASFDGYGTFYWSSNQWHGVTNAPAHALAYRDGIMAGFFPGYGLYFYQNSTFYPVTVTASNSMAFGDINQNGKTDLLGSFPTLNAMWYTQVDN